MYWSTISSGLAALRPCPNKELTDLATTLDSLEPLPVSVHFEERTWLPEQSGAACNDAIADPYPWQDECNYKRALVNMNSPILL
uniref:Uncharacterized protein n=1 Tax=Hyaloperonospora arabidopsidis (strain Emoy2) TaxID=559515 RepID=M4BSJ8_HYAAE